MHNKEYRVLKKVLLHIALLIVVLISILQFIWMLTGATNNRNEQKQYILSSKLYRN